MNHTAHRTHDAAHSRATLERSLAAAGLDWIVPDWPAPQDVIALTTTRSASRTLGGESDPAVLSAAEGDALSAFVPSPPIRLKQVHGTDVVIAGETSIGARALPFVADAVVTRLRGVVCAVSTADCLPVLFADRHGATVGVAHAGWRGLAAGVLETTVRSLDGLGGGTSDLIAWLGPAIGPAAFEVGADVYTAFCDNDAGAVRHFAPHREGKWHADLYALARDRLALAGVREITGGGWCTFSDAARFPSWRRERTAERMTTLVWLA